jgi:AraC-like DNA-binding protein
VSSDRLFESRARELAVRRPGPKLLYAGPGGPRRISGPIPFDEEVRHIAGRHELVFAVAGKARIRVPTEEFDLARGNLLLVEPGVDHAEMPTEPARSYVLCWVILDKSYAMIAHTSRSHAGDLSGGPFLELHGRTNLQNIAVALSTELSAKAVGWDLAAGALLEYLSCFLIRRIRRGHSVPLGQPESPTVAHDPAAWEIVQNALAHCRANLHRRLHVAEVAEAVGYSASRLSHLFSAYVGRSIGDYVRSMRLAAARELLVTTDLTVSQIAARVGYDDPAHFSRAFSRAQKISPRAFREKHGGL